VEAARLPPSVQNLVSGSVIDVSGASDFYKKKAEVATLLENFIELHPHFRYRLKNGFDGYFLVNLPLFLRGHPTKPADALADALFFLGRQWAKTGYGKMPIASIPSDDFLRDSWKDATDWDAFLLREGCIGEVWRHNLGANGEVRAWAGGWDPSDFELLIEFGPDTTKPPTMTIRVKGEPAAIFMRWWMTLNPNSPPQKHPGIKALQEKAETVLDAIAGRLKMNLKLTRPEKGRPWVDFGEHAAYLLDHKRQNMALIAKELCQLPQDASSSMRRRCFDRIRKAVNNYYKLLRSDYRTLTSIRVRERIVRVPGNASPVKSE
jgi:hypothetical protein